MGRALPATPAGHLAGRASPIRVVPVPQICPGMASGRLYSIALSVIRKQQHPTTRGAVRGGIKQRGRHSVADRRRLAVLNQM
jgi:hypothetical protein